MIPEIRTLIAGFRISQQKQSDEAHGVDQSDRAKLKDFDRRLEKGELN